MKYLLTIAFLVSAFTVLSLVYLWPDSKPPHKDIVLNVNGHIFTREFFNELGKKNGYRTENREDLVNSLITRELLIQEAQRLGIDKEASFRAALKNYYEQSLIKILTDRQYHSMHVQVDEAEIDAYLSCFGKVYTFTILDNDGKQHPPVRQHSVLFDDLAEPLRVLLADMKPGEVREQYDTGSKVEKIRLDAIKPATGNKPVTIDRQHARTILTEQKRSRLINTWIKSLRRKASITVYEAADSHEQKTSTKELFY